MTVCQHLKLLLKPFFGRLVKYAVLSCASTLANIFSAKQTDEVTGVQFAFNALVAAIVVDAESVELGIVVLESRDDGTFVLGRQSGARPILNGGCRRSSSLEKANTEGYREQT